MSVSIRVKGVINPDGSVACTLECDGQKAEVTFTGTEVLFAVPEPAQVTA